MVGDKESIINATVTVKVKVNKREVPSLYWKIHKVLEKRELDDAAFCRSFRINKREAWEMRKELEVWFGKKPNGEDKNSIK